MPFENSSGLNVHTHFGRKLPGGSNGEEDSVGRFHTLVYDFNNDQHPVQPEVPAGSHVCEIDASHAVFATASGSAFAVVATNGNAAGTGNVNLIGTAYSSAAAHSAAALNDDVTGADAIPVPTQAPVTFTGVARDRKSVV